MVKGYRENREGRGRKPEEWKFHNQWRRQWLKKEQELRLVKIKLTQRVEERLAHLNRNPDERRDT